MAEGSDAKFIVLLPVLNEPQTTGLLVGKVNQLHANFMPLVIDDGSQDPLRRDQFGPCLFVRLPNNMGLGVVTNIAVDHALAFGYDGVVRIDADGQHDVDDIPRLIEVLAKNDADIVVGRRRNHREAGWRGLIRTAVKSYISFVSRVITKGRAPEDMNSGFLALGPTALELYASHTLERYPEPQMFLVACRHRLRIAEVDIVQNVRKHGRSSLGLVAATRFLFRFTMLIANEALRR